MHTEEIIRAWKAEDDDERNRQAPVNPAGNIEIDDDDLGEGGDDNTIFNSYYVCRPGGGQLMI